MGMFNEYPYRNLTDLNLDYIFKIMKEVEKQVEYFVSLNAIKYADPIQWDITRQYEKNTIVIDPLTGTAYISVSPVPAGTALTRTEYWTVVFDLQRFVTKACKNFTSRYEAETTTTATFNTPKDGWLCWADVLYKANVNITAGDSYIPGGNITAFTIEDFGGHLDDLLTTDKSNVVAAINELVNVLIQMSVEMGDLNDLTTVDKTSIVNAINELVTEISNAITIIGDLNNLTTTDKTSVVNAINEIVTNIGDLNDLDTSDKSSIVNAINDIVSILPITPYVTPEEFGAIGDGVNDDTAAIQDAVNASNYVMFLSNKTYIISDEISLNNNQIINGNNSTLKIKDNIRIDEIFNVDSKKNISILNTIFDMNCQNMPIYNVGDYNNNYFPCKSIYFNNSYDLTVYHCTFKNLYTWAIFNYQSKGNISIVNNIFDSPAQSQGYVNEFIRCNSIWDGVMYITDNLFTGDPTNNDYGTPALSISNVHAKSVIDSNTLINCGRNAEYHHRLAAIDFYGDVYNSTISNNYIEAVNMFIRLEDTKNIVVENNICKDVSTDGGPLSDGYIWLFHSDRYPGEPEIENITIRNNEFFTKTGVFQGHVIRIKEFSNNHNDVFIKNVLIENNRFYRGNNKGFSAIETDGRVNGLVIKGNIFDEDGDITYIIKFVNNSGYNTVNTSCEILNNTFKGYIAIIEDTPVTFNMSPLIVSGNIFECTATEAVTVTKGIFLNNYFSFGGIKCDGDATNNSFISGNVFDDSSTNPITVTNTIYTNNLKGSNILSNN